MKCLDCDIETGFDWPTTDEHLRLLMQSLWEGPLCKVCSGDSLMRQLFDNESRLTSYALRRKRQ